jgi:tripartite-type tricarboxylate transporter receptor subunit TctC
MVKFSFAAWCIVVALALGAPLAHAQSDYPNKPVRIVVTFPPGGSTDVVARLLATRLTDRTGQQVVVENRPGAGGNIGLALVAKAPPDGYTLGVGAAGALSANVSLYPNMPFDPVKDFKPVSLLVAIPFVIVGNPAVPAKTQRELLALARAQPGKLSMGHGGNGTAMHLTAQLLAQMAGVKFNEVPYRGSGPAVIDVMGGQATLAVVDLPSSIQHIRSGRLIAYAVTSTRRLAQLPEVPTVAEADLPGFESIGWFGLVAPAGTQAPVIARLSAEINAALEDEAFRTSMRNAGADPPPPGTPEAFEGFIKSEIVKWGRVIKNAGIKLE